METDLPTSKVAKAICQAERLNYETPIGQGAYKRVFRVNAAKGTFFALKVIRSKASRARTEREIEAIRKCSHPNIGRLDRVGMIDFDNTEYTYTVEEYLGGGSLGDRLNKSGVIESEEVATIGSALVSALAQLSDLQLVHRDIKPENIMFRDDGITPVLVDFGLVRDLTATSLTPTWIEGGPGTPYFAAPEQLRNEKALIDWRTDQFSLGVTLCFSRFNTHPYQADDEERFAHQTVERVAERGQVNEALSENLKHESLASILRMIMPWPYQRYRMPADLMSAWEKGTE